MGLKTLGYRSQPGDAQMPSFANIFAWQFAGCLRELASLRTSVTVGELAWKSPQLLTLSGPWAFIFSSMNEEVRPDDSHASSCCKNNV